MKPEDLDQIFARARGEEEIEPELLNRISGAILPGLRPVRPMPPARIMVTALLLVCFGVGIAGASMLGMSGVRKLGGLEAIAIFAAVGLFAWLAASQSAAEMVPGSRRMVHPALLVSGGSLLLIALFAALFNGYAMDNFVREGIPCLRAGLIHALPAAGGSWLILRRGMALNATAAGLAAGTLAGLAGVIMLELHCANLRAVHVMTWHVAVVVVSAAVGALLARALTFRERSGAQRS